MGCEHKEGGGFYHPRQPQQTPFYQLVERFYPQFEAVGSQKHFTHPSSAKERNKFERA